MFLRHTGEIRSLTRLTNKPYRCSAVKLCPTICNPMDCSTSGFPVLHHLPEFAQTHVHQVSDVTPFSSCLQFFPPSASFPLNQLFTSGGQNIGASALVLPVNIQG